MINYSLVTQENALSGKKQTWAVAQYNEVMSSERFAKHIKDHGSNFSEGTINGVITDLSRCMRELLLEGKKVQLGLLGNFYVTLHSRTADSKDEFTADNIQSVKTVLQVGSAFEDMRSDAEFQFVPSREDQAIARRAAKAGQTITGVDSSSTGGGDVE